MTPFLLNTVAALTLVAQSSAPQAPRPFSRDSIRLAVAPALLEAQTGAQPDWARVTQLAPNDEITVVSGPTTVSGRLVSAELAARHPIAVMNADFRGNTDESWSRALGWLVRNRLLAPGYGLVP